MEQSNGKSHTNPPASPIHRRTISMIMDMVLCGLLSPGFISNPSAINPRPTGEADEASTLFPP